MSKSQIIPIFKSDRSFKRSLLTLNEAEDEIKENKPISIPSIAKHHDLNEIFIVDSNFFGFFDAYENLQDIGKQLIFGLELIVCNDANNKSRESLASESKVIIFLKNKEAYKDAIQIYSRSHIDFFYYRNRIDWKTLKDLWSDNLLLAIDFYDGFIAKNLLVFNSNCLPDFPDKPIMFYQFMDLPFDNLIFNKTKEFAEENKLPMQEVHNCFYYRKKDFKAYLTLRAIGNRSTFAKPNLDAMSSDKFSFESYLNKVHNV